MLKLYKLTGTAKGYDVYDSCIRVEGDDDQH